MKEKYIYERFNSYFKFGFSENGEVTLSGNDDICIVKNHQEADKVIADRNDVLDFLCLLNQMYPNEFDACFYKYNNITPTQ